jgi:hypothetical protein
VKTDWRVRMGALSRYLSRPLDPEAS